ncbi:gamma-glutamyltransferase family protein [Alkalibacterium pelagium]|jgi:gamma-glutamyltranspeptidase/glutathione hydrolase|uniref:Gamma-glutamyltranspeptidase / glutathione hydrolase n=1 Tax=Alkalibacterium pelagium TaxID=426702 RepID=A0A1H7FA55_9LACT|nr:gamma-glutamyltransferase family protein [Alkalibacterium pelagium]GEN49511.1 gamma-glutamyltransferase [Alkalibacterium pelagium]SEK20095.1 gamma-glutamyltranspeptidase / glutathione hydrolase [Alkalibacterium pelagium]
MGNENYDAGAFHYASRRELAAGRNGMVATSHPVAAQVGLDILKRGGNAIDAAIATAATLTVVEPGSNGIGGDSFSILWKDGKLHGLNSSGPSPQGLDPDPYLTKEKDFPTFGINAVTVPGVPAGWAALSKKHGKLPLKEVLEPAAKIAEEGYVITNTVSQAFQRTFKRFSKEKDNYPELESWFKVFAPEGTAKQALDIIKLPGHARGLRLIGETEADAFYNGKIAEAIDAFSRRHGGSLRLDDLKSFQPEWVDPVSVDYKGYQVWEMPPNGQGIVALMALNSLKHLELAGKDDAETLHKQIEAIKLAFADGNLTIADPERMTVSAEELLSERYAKERAELIGHDAIDAVPGISDSSGTVYLAAADAEGNMISYIQSNYMGFGSGAVIPEFGISLNNRAVGFTNEKGHVNTLAPAKRPFNTIIPGFLTKEGQPMGPFGVMGGHMQPQGHLQVIQSMIDFGLNPQDALDKPRWQWVKGRKVLVEPEFPFSVLTDLKHRGHDIEVTLEKGQFGRGQIILRNENGVLIGGTEPRTDGTVAVW